MHRHVHFGGGPELIGENKALLPVYVAYGVTTVRDCAADLSSSVLEWRDEVAKGTLLGPRIFTSGPKLEGYKPIWKGTLEVGTPAEVNAALDKLQAMKFSSNGCSGAIASACCKDARASGQRLPSSSALARNRRRVHSSLLRFWAWAIAIARP